MSAQRMLFLTMAIVIGLGIWLTGYKTVHWVLYIPFGFLLFAAITGFCPGLKIYRALGFK